MPSFTAHAQSPDVVQSFALDSLISSVIKLTVGVVEKSLTHLNALAKILPENSPLGSVIRGMQFLLENQQMLKIFDTTATVWLC